MTKHFCDLCEKPAVEFWPRLQVDFPEKQWRETKSEGMACVDGSWTPHVDARIVFDACEFKNQTRPHFPDLCEDCIVMLLTRMAASIKDKRATPEQAKEGFHKMREACK